jgi:hypothetical protein
MSAAAGSTWVEDLAAAVMRGLKELWGFSGDFRTMGDLGIETDDAITEQVEV